MLLAACTAPPAMSAECHHPGADRRKGLEPLDEVWRQVSNMRPRLEPVLKDAKRRVLETLLTSEFTY